MSIWPGIIWPTFKITSSFVTSGSGSLLEGGEGFEGSEGDDGCYWVGWEFKRGEMMRRRHRSVVFILIFEVFFKNISLDF